MTTEDSTKEDLREVERHHHFRRDQIGRNDRVALLEALVVDELRHTDVPDEQRDSGITWELKHQAGVTQFGRLLAAKRGLDGDLAAVGALLHDIYTIRTGSYEDHARRGGPIAEEFMSDVGGFSAADVDSVLRIVTNHSDKHITSDDEWVEFGKDVDVLDCFLYPHALDEYLLTKPLDKVKHYLGRAKDVWDELGVPQQPGFASLDHYGKDGWLTKPVTMSEFEFANLCSGIESDPSHPPVAVVQSGSAFTVLISPHAPLPRSGSSRKPALVTFNDPDEILLFWPGICRYERLTLDRAATKGVSLSALTGE